MNELTTIAFMPHGMCYLWKPGLVGLHLVSNGLIAFAYFAISITLIYILRRREDIPFNGIFLLFAAFILACGTGHAFDVWTVWHPDYWLSGGIKFLTALISCATAIVLIVKIPAILVLPSPTLVNKINQQLQEKIATLEQQEIVIRQQEEFLRSIYDNVQEAIFVVDLEADGTWRYQGLNPAAIRLTGLEEAVNKTPDEILPAEFAANLKQRYSQCLQSKTIIAYEEYLPFGGKDTWWLTTLNPLQNEAGEIYRLVGTSLNFSDRKEAETKLEQERLFINEELEARVKQRTQELEEVNALLLATTETLEKRNQELDQFAYVASHDLKAPLRAIANLAQWLEEDLADKLDADNRYNLDLLHSRVQRLENLINGLLDYSRVGRLSSKLELVNVREMVREIIDLLDVPDSCQIQIQENMPIFVTKAIPLQQVFRNLISNAIDHSGCEQGKISISFQELDNEYEFAVTDNGIGIDPRYHERIFTIFQTLEARDTKESTGIGLAIVKKAVENQGGKIKLESAVGSGSTFRFTWRKQILRAES